MYRDMDISHTPHSTSRVFFFFLFFWTGLRDPIACSKLGGRILTQNSGYKSTRLCPSKFRFLLLLRSSLPCFRPIACLVWSLIRNLPRSIPIHSTRLLPETPPLLLSPRSIPHPTPPPNPVPISSLSPPPVSSPPPSLFRSVPTTAKTPSLPAAKRPSHIGPE